MKQLPKRSEVKKEYTWDLTLLFKTEELYEKKFSETLEKTVEFESKYKGKLNNETTINEAILEYQELLANLRLVGSYQSLYQSGDSTDEKNIIRSGNSAIAFAKVANTLAFFISELKENSEETLRKASLLVEGNKLFLEEIIKEKKHSLSKEVEIALAQFQQVLNAPYQNYSRFKLADMQFPDFSVNEKTHPLSFTLFENEWEYDIRHEERRKAYEEFYQVLAKYQNGLANNYQTEVLKEKAMATLKGYNSVIDYLLDDQDVSRDMYDRQIDVIMSDLAPVMQRYAKLLKNAHGLEEMTFADLKISLDPLYEPNVTIEESKELLLEGLSIFGDEYKKMVNDAFSDRWIDFSQNVGKSTGGFCSTPYGANSFILINWNGQMNEVFVLAHELGHAGHFYYANKFQNILNARPSLYFIEAPSTMNELLLANHMLKNAKDNRFKRFVYASMIARTYYHNCVTHLLEASYQREVYLRVDKGLPLSAKVLNDIKLGTIKKFWGDAVNIPDYAGLTWMRQPHYFMGLYPYTYSAGLTLATAVSQKLLNNEIKIDQWVEVLKKGGTKKPLELAKMVDVDLSTDKPLKDAIKFIDSLVTELEKLA